MAQTGGMRQVAPSHVMGPLHVNLGKRDVSGGDSSMVVETLTGRSIVELFIFVKETQPEILPGRNVFATGTCGGYPGLSVDQSLSQRCHGIFMIHDPGSVSSALHHLFLTVHADVSGCFFTLWLLLVTPALKFGDKR